MFVGYRIDGSLQDVMQVVEEVRSEMGMEPIAIYNENECLLEFHQTDAVAVAKGSMTQDEYFDKHRI